MELGQVNILRRYLSRFKEIISQEYRREVLSEIICEEIFRLKKTKRNEKIRLLDYGSGYNPILIKKIIQKLKKKYRFKKLKAYCYDFYTEDHLKKLNKEKNIVFEKMSKFKDKNRFDFCLIIDVLHHVGLKNEKKIFQLIKKLKTRSKILIIKDHFQYGVISNLLLLTMDIFSNYGDGTKIPDSYFSLKTFDEFLNKNKLYEIKRISDKKYYKWYWPYVNNSKFQFMSITKNMNK